MVLWQRLLDAVALAHNSIAEYLAGDRTAPENSIAFTIGLIGLSAKMAKADGVVSPTEVMAFRGILDIREEDHAAVARVFDLAKQDVAGFDTYARQLAKLFARKPEMLADVLDGLFHISKADGTVHERELAYLASVADIFGLSGVAFDSFVSRHIGTPQTQAYDILGADPAWSNAALKARYLNLVREHHPDRHIAAGVPPEAVRIVTERLARINAAYDAIAEERGL